jgi:hypothetical protein
MSIIIRLLQVIRQHATVGIDGGANDLLELHDHLSTLIGPQQMGTAKTDFDSE